MTLDHEYQPDPQTGQCLACPPLAIRKGRCQWCGHGRAEHGGRVPAEVLAHYATVTHRHRAPISHPGGGDGTREHTHYSVDFSTTACSVSHCACKRYES